MAVNRSVVKEVILDAKKEIVRYTITNREATFTIEVIPCRKWMLSSVPTS